MNSIKQIREALQLNQEDLAIYLGITRSLLSLAEINKRELPTPALLKLTALYQSLPQNITTENLSLVAAELTTENSNLDNYLKENATKKLRKVVNLQKQLTAMQAHYNNALQTLQTIRTLQNNLTNTKQNKKDKLWCAAIEAILLEKIKANGLVQQKKLEIKISCL